MKTESKINTAFQTGSRIQTGRRPLDPLFYMIFKDRDVIISGL